RTPRSQRRTRHRMQIQPPLRGGINASPMILPEGHWQTLGEWAIARFGESSNDSNSILDYFTRDCFLADHNIPLTPDTPYEPGMRIWVFRPVLDEPATQIMLDVVYEDEKILVVDKPHGMASIPRGSHVANTVTVAARRQFENDALVCAHRLDLETAGLVLLTKAQEYRAAYQNLFSDRAVHKKYYAVAPMPKKDSEFESLLSATAEDGWLEVELPLYRPEGQLNVEVLADGECELETGATLEEKPGVNTRPKIWRSRTKLRLVKEIPADEAVLGEASSESLALYELAPETGYIHQLRVTLNYFQVPICGDPLYPRLFTKAEEAQRVFPLQLLAHELRFVDPYSGQERCFCSRRKLFLEQ
ncbi:MAG: pseudouridine synthase, partial [Arcanobacterium sp.]|nr:pseudouridine synthase [Arcanobacterium sp.]